MHCCAPAVLLSVGLACGYILYNIVLCGAFYLTQALQDAQVLQRLLRPLTLFMAWTAVGRGRTRTNTGVAVSALIPPRRKNLGLRSCRLLARASSRGCQKTNRDRLPLEGPKLVRNKSCNFFLVFSSKYLTFAKRHAILRPLFFILNGTVRRRIRIRWKRSTCKAAQTKMCLPATSPLVSRRASPRLIGKACTVKNNNCGEDRRGH